MGKTAWDIDQILLFGREGDAGPLAESGRADANVDRNIQGFAFDDATELGLGVQQLIVKAAKSSAGGGGVIVLKKDVFDAEVYEFGVVVSFEERAARVAMDHGAQLIDTW